MPDPSLAIFCWYVQAYGIHWVQEWHLIMRLVVINLPSPWGTEFLYGVEEWRVRWKEKWHHPGMGCKPFCDCMRVVQCHSVPYNYTHTLISAHCIPFLTCTTLHRAHPGTKAITGGWSDGFDSISFYFSKYILIKLYCRHAANCCFIQFCIMLWFELKFNPFEKSM